MRRLLFAATVLAALAASAEAGGVTPRSHVVVQGPEVRLSDLFDGPLPRGDRVLGPAPAPGRVYTVEPAQLAAIARANGITLASPVATVVERPGRPLARESVERALREALLAAGAIETMEAPLILQGYTAPVVPLSVGAPRIVVEDLGWDASQARFNASVAAIVGAEPPIRVRIAGRVEDTVAVPVPVRRLAEGETIRPGDLRLVRMPAARVPADAELDPQRLAGRMLRETIPAGAPISAGQVGAAAMVSRGQPVAMLVELPGLSITAQGRALEDGERGARVQVMNSASRAVVEGVVIGPGRVRVSADSTPLRQAQHTAGQSDRLPQPQNRPEGRR
ncbi:flagellar basal body P-ring formation chaperone FlgA [Elioraea tepida]|jgi:flagella basal body P-ring formation protein FlgA|uniref:Flagellar basal body P-ring formation chaperone FlgA n=1 Tax=Elioraea tepida TaxID=2843330 RepID=A0A975U492_9PROT|nr:flagellar basal body P-ring formation chaperone FlgA [Elioraea tepida]QXM25294.1 flagellar basal body P-ring formation chaperone FlgA [Elioraea tepida]